MRHHKSRKWKRASEHMLESRSSAKQPADEAHVELSELAAAEAALLGVDAARCFPETKSK